MRAFRVRRATICIVVTLTACSLMYLTKNLLTDDDKSTKSAVWFKSLQEQKISRSTEFSQKAKTTQQNILLIKTNTTSTSETKSKERGKEGKHSTAIQNRKHLIKRHGRQHRFGGSFSLNLRRRPAILADELDNGDDWWKAFIELTEDLRAVKKEYRCPHMQSRGNWWDCNWFPYKASKPCLVYSFGIGNDFRFDDEMATLGCEVHSFDPSMNVTEHKRESGVYFHPIGIGDRSDNRFRPWSNEYTVDNPNKTWEIRSLSAIMSQLGHTNKSLDILKLDIEGYEWEVLYNIIADNILPQIKQLEVEFHIFPNFPPRQDYVRALQVYQALLELDFKRYYSSVHQYHPDKDKTHLQADIAYVNENYK